MQAMVIHDQRPPANCIKNGAEVQLDSMKKVFKSTSAVIRKSIARSNKTPALSTPKFTIMKARKYPSDVIKAPVSSSQSNEVALEESKDSAVVC